MIEVIKFLIEHGSQYSDMLKSFGMPTYLDETGTGFNEFKKILEIPLKVNNCLKKLDTNLDIKEIKEASEDPNTGALFQANFLKRAQDEQDGLDSNKLLQACRLDSKTSNNFILALEAKFISPEQFAEFIRLHPSQGVAIPQEHQQKIVQHVIEDISNKGGVWADSLVEYQNNISKNFPFLKEPLERLKKEAFDDIVMALYHVDMSNLLSAKEREAIPEIDVAHQIFVNQINENFDEKRSPNEAQLIDDLIIKKYQEDPSLLLAAMLKVIEKISPLQDPNPKLERAHERIAILQQIIMPDSRSDGKPDGQLLKFFATQNQMHDLHFNLDIMSLRTEAYKQRVGKLSTEQYEQHYRCIEEEDEKNYSLDTKIKKPAQHIGKTNQNQEVKDNNPHPTVDELSSAPLTLKDVKKAIREGKVISEGGKKYEIREGERKHQIDDTINKMGVKSQGKLKKLKEKFKEFIYTTKIILNPNASTISPSTKNKKQFAQKRSK
ncbi:hypothetical protein [Candidatus Tisiphia endosymbiont of Nemotelus uliginosus]|uniref:hypothetical protein n=1 Tax=Candidatus Tisiphia endosymbiont of Nemotelus uliginosus TaxID=3077926 RepID=UPI0035C88E15